MKIRTALLTSFPDAKTGLHVFDIIDQNKNFRPWITFQ